MATASKSKQATKRLKKGAVKKNVVTGKVTIRASFNNTIVTIADDKGNVISQSSAGKNFKGSRKSTPFAAQEAATEAVRLAKERAPNLVQVSVVVIGPGSGRESALRAVAGGFKQVTSISDKTPIPHNGCRPKKPRRV